MGIFSSTPVISSVDDDSSSTSGFSEVTPVTSPVASPDTSPVDSKKIITNLKNYSVGNPKLGEFIDKYGMYRKLIKKGDEYHSIHDKKVAISTISNRAYEFYTSIIKGVAIKSLIGDIYLWDNYVVFVDTDDDTKILRYFEREIYID